jgi:hypothetical protein
MNIDTKRRVVCQVSAEFVGVGKEDQGRSRPLPPKAVFGPAFTPGSAGILSRCLSRPFTGVLGFGPHRRQGLKPQAARRPACGPDTSSICVVPGPGINAGPNTAKAETPVNGRTFSLHQALSLNGRRRSSVRVLAIVALVGSVLYCRPITADEAKPAGPGGEPKPKDQWHWPKVTISKETTYFTEPLRPDGGVDYVAALNRRLSEGVTPEKNAAVALWQMYGPKGIDGKIRKQYLQALGIPELPEAGDYVTWDFPEYKEAQKRADNEEAFARELWSDHSAATRAPWSKSDYPVWAAFFERNEKPLTILVDGLQRPRFYLPPLSRYGDLGLIASCDQITGNSEAREAARLLIARSMLRLHDGDLAGAWSDIMALYRLGRLESQRGYAVGWMTGATFCDIASNAAATLSQHAKLTAGQSREFQSQLRNLSPMRSLASICDEWERCSSLETLAMVADAAGMEEHFRNDAMLENMFKPAGPKPEDPKRDRRHEALKRLTADGGADWSEVFRQHNIFWNGFVDACRPGGRKSVAHLAAFETAARREADRTADDVLSQTPTALKSMTRDIQARHIAKLSVLFSTLKIQAMEIEIEQQREARECMALLALALSAYRTEHGAYPKTLGETAPVYIDAIPKDPFSDGPLHYKSEGNGYLLYSVGQNGKDDGGYGPGNEPDSITEEQQNAWPKPWDDLSIRTPPKQVKQKP